MLQLAWILSYAILVAAYPEQPCKQGSQTSTLRIIDGYEIEIKDRPFQVNLNFVCGGSIIGSKWIITAAHCTPPQMVIVGSKYRDGGDYVYVKNVIVHPSYDAKSLNYDMMLIELADELVFNETVQPILLDDGKETMIGEEAVASGWGWTEKCVYPEMLLALKLSIMNHSDCQAALDSAGNAYNENTMICASSPGSIFPGDSGGPLTVGSKLVGISSWCYSNNDVTLAKKYPSVFTRVSSARDWIRKETGI